MSLSSERGSVVASHAMVTALIVAVVVALMQLAGALYVRGIVVDAAAAGARKAALVYSSPDEAAARVRDLVSGAAPGVQIGDVRVGEEPAGRGRTYVRVDVEAALPVIGPWGLPGTLHAVGHAVREEPPS